MPVFEVELASKVMLVVLAAVTETLIPFVVDVADTENIFVKATHPTEEKVVTFATEFTAAL